MLQNSLPSNAYRRPTKVWKRWWTRDRLIVSFIEKKGWESVFIDFGKFRFWRTMRQIVFEGERIKISFLGVLIETIEGTTIFIISLKDGLESHWGCRLDFYKIKNNVESIT